MSLSFLSKKNFLSHFKEVLSVLNALTVKVSKELDFRIAIH